MLKGFTSKPRPKDICPHGCAHWAIQLHGQNKKVADKDGHLHHQSCPVVRDVNEELLRIFNAAQ